MGFRADLLHCFGAWGSRPEGSMYSYNSSVERYGPYSLTALQGTMGFEIRGALKEPAEPLTDPLKEQL